MIMALPIPSLIPSLSHSLIPSLSLSLTHSLALSLTHSLARSLSHSLIPSLSHSLIPSLSELTHSLALSGSLIPYIVRSYSLYHDKCTVPNLLTYTCSHLQVQM